MSTLEALHPGFFPVPVYQRLVAPGHFTLSPKKSGFLTKPEFIKLYNQTCGNALHRGSLKNLLSSKQSLTALRQDIADLIAKIVTLLDHHIIMLIGGASVLLCGMKTKETGEIQVVLGDSIGDVVTPVET
jgi:hypothetical protein